MVKLATLLVDGFGKCHQLIYFFFLVYLSSTYRLTINSNKSIYICTVWYPITTIPPSDFMGSNSHGYWGDKLMHRAGFDLATYHMRRPHVLVELVHLLNQCATLPP